MVVFGEKVVVFGKGGGIWAKVAVLGESLLYCGKMLYSGKVVEIQEKWLCS